MQGEIALDVIECGVSLERVDTFMSFVNHEHVPSDFGQLLELVELAAEIEGSL